MQKELEANSHKGEIGDWKDCDIEYLSNDVLYHAAKMIHAIRHGETEKVIEFAADTANMAMMVRDAYVHQRGLSLTKEGE